MTDAPCQTCAETRELIRLLVTRIQLEMRGGRLPFHWGGAVMEKAIAVASKAQEQGQ